MRKIARGILFVLLTPSVIAQDYTFRLRGSSPYFGGLYSITDIIFWIAAFAIAFTASYVGLKKVPAFAKEERSAKVIAAGIGVATVTFFMSTEFAFGGTLQRAFSGSTLSTPIILIVGALVFFGVKKLIEAIA